MRDWYPGGAEWDECNFELAHEQHGWAQKGGRVNREELKAAVKKAYSKGYYDGFNDACDTFMAATHKTIIDLVVDMKKSVKENEVEAFDEYEEEE